MQQVDVLVNVFSKPWQTAFSLLTLLQHSGKHIDKIYFQEEPAHSEFEKTSHERLLRYIGDKIIYFQPEHWLGVEPLQEKWLQDVKYRHSLRYQYGFEKSNKQYVLLIHNDIGVFGDIVGFLMNEIEDFSGVGQIGQCWWCPAKQNKLCEPAKYSEYKPSFEALHELYVNGFYPLERRAYHYGWGEKFKKNPWPLPECRLNEWCALIDRKKTMADTFPFGTAMPFGAHVASGACIGENFDEPVNLDTGGQWFRDLSLMGHRFKHVDIYSHITHEKKGRDALLNRDLYLKNEITTKHTLRVQFPDF